MSIASLALPALALLSPSSPELTRPTGHDSAPKPNVVIVLVDDLGWGDLGGDFAAAHPPMAGLRGVRTPRLTAFASEGLVMTQGYSAAPNCAPSRASLQTGRYTPRHGILTVGSSARGKAENRHIVPTKNRTVLGDEEVTLAELLAPAGYSSAHIGKWHLGDDPRTQGYDVNVGGTKRGHPKSYFSPYRNDSLPDGPEGEYLTERLTDEAIDLLDTLEPPFLMHLAYYTVHTPHQAPPERVAALKKAGAPNAVYTAMVEALDEQVGRLLDALDQRGLDENTIVVFTSDNGGFHSVTNSEALRGHKGTLDEGGVRVPWIVRWPGVIAPGVSEDPVHHVDLAPTLAGIADVPAPQTFDGVDILATWKGDLAPDRTSLYWHFPCYLEGKSDRFPAWRTTPGGSVRAGDFKLIEYFEPDASGLTRVELYDLEADPLEQEDLASLKPATAANLHSQLAAWRASVDAEVPSEAEPKSADAGGRGLNLAAVARDPSLWEAVQRSGRAHQDFEAKAASWTHAELMGALDELLFGEIKRGRKRALTRALRQHPRRIRPALLEMLTAGAFREAFETGDRLETACELLGNTPPPGAVDALVPFLSCENGDARAQAAFAIGRVGTLRSVRALVPVLSGQDDRARGLALVGLEYPTMDGRLSAPARDALFDVLMANVETLKDEYGMVDLLFSTDQDRAVAALTSPQQLTPEGPLTRLVLRTLADGRLSLGRSRCLELLGAYEAFDSPAAFDSEIGDLYTLLGRHALPEDRPRIEAATRSPHGSIAEAAALGLAASHGLEDGLSTLFDGVIDGTPTGKNPGAQMLWDVFLLDSEINNGGFLQYWFNSSGDDWLSALAGLKAVGLDEREPLLKSATRRFGSRAPSTDRTTRQEQLADILTDENEEPFREDDDHWYDCQQSVEVALLRYMIEHREALGLGKGDR